MRRRSRLATWIASSGYASGDGCDGSGITSGSLYRSVWFVPLVSPSARGYRFYFFSREEPRLHVHVQHADGEAKFWLEPDIELAQNYGLRADHVELAEQLIREHQDEIRAAWQKHFPS